MIRHCMGGIALVAVAPCTVAAQTPSVEASLAAILEASLPGDTFFEAQFAMLDAQFQKNREGDSAWRKLEAEYPGIGRAVAADIRKGVEPLFRDGLVRRLVATLTAYYRETFTPAELADLAAFYRTPTGRKMVRAGQTAGADAARKHAEPAELTVQAANKVLDAVTSSAAAGALQAMTAEDMPVLRQFMTTSASRKILDTQPELQQRIARTITDFMREVEPQLNTIIRGSIDRQVTARSAKRRR